MGSRPSPLVRGTVLRTADLRSRHANMSLAVATATTTPRHAAFPRPRPPPGRDLTREPSREPSPGNAGRPGARPAAASLRAPAPCQIPPRSRLAAPAMAGAHATRPARHAAKRQHTINSEHDSHQQKITVPAKVDGPFHMSCKLTATLASKGGCAVLGTTQHCELEAALVARLYAASAGRWPESPTRSGGGSGKYTLVGMDVLHRIGT